MKPILFVDFNGVISYQNFWNSIYSEDHKLFNLRNDINTFVFVENKNFVKDWMVGLHTAEEAHDLIKEKFDIDKDYLFEIFKKDAETIDVSEKILLKLQDLKSKYKVVMITDNMDTFTRFTLPNNPEISRTFDGIFVSFHTGKLKKTDEGKVFKNIVNLFDSKLEESILVDDSKSNCELFESIGGKSICITGENEVIEKLNSL